MHVAEHVLDGVVSFDAPVVHAAVRFLIDVYRVGVTEQVVHVTENFLIGAHQENPQQIIFAFIEGMNRQAGLDALLVDVLLDLAVGVAGQILQDRTAIRLFVETVQRQDRQYLANRPGVRQALEHREVADVLVGELVIEFVQHLTVRTLARLQRVVQTAADREVALLGQGFLRQRDLAIRILRGNVTHVVRGTPVGFGDHLDVGRPEQVYQPLHGLRQAFLVSDLRDFVVVPFDVSHLHHQHRVMRRQRAAAFGENVRMRQLLLVAEVLEHADHDTGVIVHVVVDRAGIARVSTVVVHAQATAHVDMVDRQAQIAQFAVVADRLFEPVLIVSQVGDLRPHVEVQQAHALIKARRAETLDHGQQLRCRQTELGFLTAGISPFA